MAIMVSVSLVLLFVLFVVLRKVFKTNKVEGIVSISASNLNAQKIVHEDDIGGWDKLGFEFNPCTQNFVRILLHSIYEFESDRLPSNL